MARAVFYSGRVADRVNVNLVAASTFRLFEQTPEKLQRRVRRFRLVAMNRRKDADAHRFVNRTGSKEEETRNGKDLASMAKLADLGVEKIVGVLRFGSQFLDLAGQYPVLTVRRATPRRRFRRGVGARNVG